MTPHLGELGADIKIEEDSNLIINLIKRMKRIITLLKRLFDLYVDVIWFKLFLSGQA
jgi:hypothetical protein